MSMIKLLPLIVGVLLTTAPVAAAPVFPKSSGVGLEPPAGMVEADRFLGFIDGRASIVISELPPQAYAQVAGKKEQFAARVEGARIEDFKVAGADAFLIVGKQEAAGLTFRRWVVIIGDPSETAIVTAQVPAEVPADDKRYGDAAILAALHTIVVRPRPDLAAQVAALPFAIGDEADFRPVLTSAGNAVVLTDGPRDHDPAFTQPIIAVDTDLDFREAPPGQDREAFARQRFLDVAKRHVEKVSILGSKLSQENGDDVVRIDATGSKPPSQKPAALIGYMRFTKGGFVRTLCILPQQTHAEYAARCAQLAGSERMK